MSKQFELLNKYYAHTLTNREKRLLISMIRHSDIGAEDEFDRVWDHSIGEMPHPVDERIQKAINSTTKYRCHYSRNITFYIAACITLFITTATTLYYRHENSLLTCYTDMNIRVGKGQKSDVCLPDGTRVRLNADSQLSYGTEFNGRHRVVKLEGEAYFEVEKDPAPFIVKVNELKIEAVGTAFNIQAYPNSEQITTYLLEGCVKISQNNTHTLLAPNDVAIYSKVYKSIHKRKATDNRLYTAWMHNEMIFDNEPLTEIVHLLERNYNVTISMKSDKLKNVTFSGTLKNVSLQSTLDALQFTSDITIKYNAHEIEIDCKTH